MMTTLALLGAGCKETKKIEKETVYEGHRVKIKYNDPTMLRERELFVYNKEGDLMIYGMDAGSSLEFEKEIISENTPASMKRYAEDDVMQLMFSQAENQ